MKFAHFADGAHEPTRVEIAEALGSRKALWDRLVQFVDENYQMPGEMRYGGKNYGWNLCFRHKDRTLLTLYPLVRCFVAQVVLGREQADHALAIQLGQNARQVLEETPHHPDGRWLFIRVSTVTDARDVEKLLVIKKRPLALAGR
jgi:hypothetical protein